MRAPHRLNWAVLVPEHSVYCRCELCRLESDSGSHVLGDSGGGTQRFYLLSIQDPGLY